MLVPTVESESDAAGGRSMSAPTAESERGSVAHLMCAATRRFLRRAAFCGQIARATA